MTAEALTRLATFEVSLPWSLVTPNSRLHWGAKARIVADLRASVGIQALSWRKAHSLPPADGRRALSLVLVRGKRQRFLDEADNLPAALKPCLDSLKDAGIIVDDAARHVEVKYSQGRGDKPALRITVWGA
jgi:hypothetical protein